MSIVAERVAPISTTAPPLRATDVSKTYRSPDHSGRLVLGPVDFTLREGEIVEILAKSGSGKSTFLRILAGLLPASEGRVEYRGQPVAAPVRGIAMVFQSFALFPWLTVLGNVELGLEAQGVSAAERRRRAVDAIDVIGLDGFESAYPKELFADHITSEVGEVLQVVAHGAAIEITAADGVEVEPLSPFPVERGGNRTRIALGDLVSDQQLAVVLRFRFA